MQNSAAVQGNQVYGPYGTQHYSQGSMNTNKGYTGQYADPLTGFDYYNARYYDPVCGVFLSADPVEGNMQGMNPYAYVDGNPETYNDPTGEMYAPPPGSGGNGSGGGGTPPPSPPPSCQGWCWVQQQWNNFYNNDVQPAEHFAQQVPEVIIHDVISHVPIIVPILIGVAIAGAIGSGAYAIWQFTHTNSNWSNVVTGNGVTHPRWLWKNKAGQFNPHIGINQGHVLSKHVLDKSTLLNRVKQMANNSQKEETATTFTDQATAQWTVNYALAHMTAAQRLQLLFMRGSPFGRFATLTLTGDTGSKIGWGYRYNPNTGQLTRFTNLSSYRVVVGIDFKTGQPIIITAFPTP